MKSEELPKERTNGNKSAYPVHGGHGDDLRNHIIGGGMSKREAFAMAAMQGLLSNSYYMERLENNYKATVVSDMNRMLVMESLDMADELLNRLENGSK